MGYSITGIFNILATPFTSSDDVDHDSLARLVDFQIKLGVAGLTALGVLGEAAKLTVDERRAVMDTVFRTNDGRVRVVVGTSHKDLDTCINLSKAAQDAGADGVMIAPPPMDTPTDDDIIALYCRIAEHIDIPIVVQDFPPVNNVTMTPAMLAKLAETVPTCRTIKLEDPPLMQKISAIRAATDRYDILGGLGGMFLLEELKRGAAGTMTGFAFNEVLLAVYDAFTAGDQARATRIFDHFLPLIRFENQPVINLPIRKLLLHLRGVIAHPGLRQPFTPIDQGTRDEVHWVLKRVGIDDPTAVINFDSF